MIKARALIPVKRESSADANAFSDREETEKKPGAPEASDLSDPADPDVFYPAASSSSFLPSSSAASGQPPAIPLESLLPDPGTMNIQTSSEYDNEVPQAVISLAEQMLDEQELLSGPVELLRKLIPARKYQFVIPVSDRSEEERIRLTELLEAMDGVLADVRLVTCGGPAGSSLSIIGRIIPGKRALRFITGSYVELGLYRKACTIVSRLAASMDKTWKIYRNVLITDQDHAILNEFDLVIEFGGQLYVLEIKSGHHFSSFDKYMEIIKTYGLEHRFLLVGSSLDQQRAQRIEYFCGYPVSTLAPGEFEQKLTTLLKEGDELSSTCMTSPARPSPWQKQSQMRVRSDSEPDHKQNASLDAGRDPVLDDEITAVLLQPPADPDGAATTELKAQQTDRLETKGRE